MSPQSCRTVLHSGSVDLGSGELPLFRSSLVLLSSLEAGPRQADIDKMLLLIPTLVTPPRDGGIAQ